MFQTLKTVIVSSSRPPLVVFLIALASTGLALLGLAFFVTGATDFVNKDVLGWDTFLFKVIFCVWYYLIFCGLVLLVMLAHIFR
jgi:hypothetical protein